MVELISLPTPTWFMGLTGALRHTRCTRQLEPVAVYIHLIHPNHNALLQVISCSQDSSCYTTTISVGLGTKLGLMFWGMLAICKIPSLKPGVVPQGKPHFHSTLSLGKALLPFKPKALKVWEKPHIHSTNPIILHVSNTLFPKILTSDMIPGHTCI